MASYSDYLPSISVPWLGGYWGGSWHQIWGALIDKALTDAATLAVNERHLRYASADALDLAGVDSQIGAGGSESTDSYRTRLIARWDRWATAGTAYGLQTELAALGYTAAIEEGFGGKWWQFRVTIYAYPAGTIIDAWLYGDGTTWGQAGRTWGGVAAGVSQSVKNLVLTMKSSHSVCPSIRFLKGVDLWGVGGTTPYFTWGDGTTWGGTVYEIGGI